MAVKRNDAGGQCRRAVGCSRPNRHTGTCTISPEAKVLRAKLATLYFAVDMFLDAPFPANRELSALIETMERTRKEW